MRISRELSRSIYDSIVQLLIEIYRDYFIIITMFINLLVFIELNNMLMLGIILWIIPIIFHSISILSNKYSFILQ